MHYIINQPIITAGLEPDKVFQNNSIQELFQFFQIDTQDEFSFFIIFVALFIVISCLIRLTSNAMNYRTVSRLAPRLVQAYFLKLSIWVINGMPLLTSLK